VDVCSLTLSLGVGCNVEYDSFDGVLVVSDVVDDVLAEFVSSECFTPVPTCCLLFARQAAEQKSFDFP
jgi:hypothetical protein